MSDRIFCISPAHAPIVSLLLLVSLGCESGSSEDRQPPQRTTGSSLPAGEAATATGIAGFPQLKPSDWPWWRGPEGNGIAPESSRPPTVFSDNENVVWKAEVPGRGHASPTVVGDLVVLATADEAKQIQSVVAFDRNTGDKRWQREISQGGFPKSVHPKNTHATSTVASDGERLFALFFHHETLQAAALDLRGEIVWQKSLGEFNPKQYEYGHAASPVVYRDTAIFTGEYDGDAFIVALDRPSGEEKWRIKRPRNVSYSTPAIGHVAGRDQLLISGADKVWSYDPTSGNALWSAAGTTAATCGTMVWDGDIVVASGGYPKSETIALRADGSGAELWRNNVKCYEQSLLAYRGYVYALADTGVLYCWRMSDGKEMWKQRLAGPISASPILANGNIYWTNEAGRMFVFRANPEQYETVARNQLGDEAFASPAVSGNHLFLRVASGRPGSRQEWLYCLGDSQP